MIFEEIKEEEFRKFLDKHPLKTFIQTPEMAKIREEFGYNHYYVGVKKDSILVAATMIGSKKRHFGMYEFYAPRGLLVDYENYDILSFFTKELKKFIKSKKGYVLRIDPYYITKEKDIDGNDIEGGIDHSYGIKNLRKCGYKRSKDIYQQFKYMFALNLNKTREELLKCMNGNTRRAILKAEENHINIKEAKFDELLDVKNLIDETSERKNFHTRNLKYYELLYKNFILSNNIKFLLGELDINEYQKIKIENIKRLENGMEKLKTPSKIGQYKEQIENEKKLLEESKNIKVPDNGKIYISAGVFILYGDEVVYLFGGNKTEYLSFGASYLMPWSMIEYGLKNNYTKYNFYGISSPSKEDGVYSFKRGFNGYVEELIGDYELPVAIYYYIDKILHILK